MKLFIKKTYTEIRRIVKRQRTERLNREREWLYDVQKRPEASSRDWTEFDRHSMVSSGRFIDPRLGDKVNSCIELSYRPAGPCSLAGRFDNPAPELTLSPQSGSMNSATGQLAGCAGK
jgi:hypothetical protein